MFSTEPILWVQQFASPALDVFFSAITLLGTQYAYIVILVSLYWCVDRRIAHRLAMVFLASMWVNGYLKETFQTPRPSPDDGVRVLARESSFSFPSGHAQGSATLWGWLALACRSWKMWLAAALLVLLIGLSRIYLGAHYAGDVLGGWALAVLAIGLFSAAEAFVKRVGPSRRARLAAAIVVPLLLFPLYPTGTGPQILGVLMGWIGSDVFALEAIAYRERTSVGRQIAKALVGFSGIGVLLAVVSRLPEGLPEALGWAVTSLWVSLGAPLLFIRLGLNGMDEASPGVGRSPGLA